jgi:hypothetical protein
MPLPNLNPLTALPSIKTAGFCDAQSPPLAKFSLPRRGDQWFFRVAFGLK